MSGDYADERARPAAPAWATVPTNVWQRVNPGEEEELDESGQPRVPQQGRGGRPTDAAGAPPPPTPARPGAGRATVPTQRSGQAPPPGGPHPPQQPAAYQQPNAPRPNGQQRPPAQFPPGTPPQGYPQQPGHNPQGGRPAQPPRGPQQPGPQPGQPPYDPRDPRNADPRGHDPRRGPQQPGAYPPSRGPGQQPGPQQPGQYPPGQHPQSQHPGAYPQGPPGGQYPPGQHPGQYPPGQRPPGGQYPPGQGPGGQYPPGQFPPGQGPAGGRGRGGQAPGQRPGERGRPPAGQPGGAIPPWAGPTPLPDAAPGPVTAYAGPQHPPGAPAPVDQRRPGGKSKGAASVPVVTPPVSAPPPVVGPPIAAAPVSAAPVSAAPVSAAPVSAPPTVDEPPFSAFGNPEPETSGSEAPVSGAPVSGVPVSAAPVSGVPVSAVPVSAAPVSAAPVSGAPVSGAPVSGVPVSAAPVSGGAESVSSPPVSAPPAEPAPPAGPDPEQILSTFEWVFDPETLREVCEDADGMNEIREMLTTKINKNTDNASRARLLSLRAVVSRILGDLHKALADAKLGVAHAEATGELRRIAIAQARLAHVLQWRGEYAEADRLFAEANSSELPDRLRGTMHQHAGKSAYDQGRYIEACNHFERALELRKEEDPDLMASTELALDAVFRQVAKNGWGPYPRSREEILQIQKPPSPAMDESTGLWGFTDAEGDTRVSAHYADIQPFRDGAAWVRRPEFETWELIDEQGETLIPPTAGYLGVSSFSGGLAWVSRDGNRGWIAVDKANTVTISTGFDDVRPFRRGIAAVRRGGRWGAVDGVGRVIVPFTFEQFATALSDGRYIDGFSDEGLAVVQTGGRKGVVDRTGRMLVEPVFTSLVIHPVAFLITDDAGKWGALDRKGRILIDPTHPSRISVTLEIDRLLADSKPVL